MSLSSKILLKLMDRANLYRRQRAMAGLRKMVNVNIDASFIFLGSENPFVIQGEPGKLFIGKNVACRRYCNFLLHTGSELSIGDDVFFNNYCSVNCLGAISIGKNVLFGEGVKLYDHNHIHGRHSNGNLFIERRKFDIGSIVIGANSWIGSNVTILKDVEIGENVIIGANNLVYQSIPANTIVKANSNLIIEPRR